MKNKKMILKITALVAALVLIGGVLWFANGLVGNPISKLIARHSVEQYLAEKYPNTDYKLDSIDYNFKNGCYYAIIKSPSSIDTVFTVDVSLSGKILYDSYSSVSSGFNTFQRLEKEYRALTDPVFENPGFPYHSDIMYGTLEFCDRSIDENSDIPSYAIPIDSLIRDKVYDVRELGKQAGILIVYIEDNEINADKAAEALLSIKRSFDEAGVPFKAIDFVLQLPLPEEGPRPEGEVHVNHFLYEDIYEEGLAERITEADRILTAKYEAMDAEKAAE